MSILSFANSFIYPIFPSVTHSHIYLPKLSFALYHALYPHVASDSHITTVAQALYAIPSFIKFLPPSFFHSRFPLSQSFLSASNYSCYASFIPSYFTSLHSLSIPHSVHNLLPGPLYFLTTHSLIHCLTLIIPFGYTLIHPDSDPVPQVDRHPPIHFLAYFLTQSFTCPYSVYFVYISQSFSLSRPYSPIHSITFLFSPPLTPHKSIPLFAHSFIYPFSISHFPSLGTEFSASHSTSQQFSPQLTSPTPTANITHSLTYSSIQLSSPSITSGHIHSLSALSHPYPSFSLAYFLSLSFHHLSILNSLCPLHVILPHSFCTSHPTPHPPSTCQYLCLLALIIGFIFYPGTKSVRRMPRL
jgi:hypothetical protein